MLTMHNTVIVEDDEHVYDWDIMNTEAGMNEISKKVEAKKEEKDIKMEKILGKKPDLSVKTQPDFREVGGRGEKSSMISPMVRLWRGVVGEVIIYVLHSQLSLNTRLILAQHSPITLPTE